MQHLYLFILLALLSEILGTVGGFGSSLFFVPIASYFLDFYSVLGITALFHVSSNLTKIYFFRKGVDKKLVFSIGIPAVIFVIIGAMLSKYVNVQILQIALSVFLISISLLLLFFNKLIIQPTIINSVSGGVLSGLVAGLVGTGGAIRGMVLAAFDLKTEIFIATSALIDLGIDCSRSGIYVWNGYVHQHDLYLIPILFVVSISGTFIGKKILEKISAKHFKTIVLVLVLVTGLLSLLKIFFPSLSLI